MPTDDRDQPLAHTTRAERAELPPSGLLPLSEDVRRDLTHFISGALDQVQAAQGPKLERVRTWRRYLGGKNPRAALRPGLSNVSVPFMLWAAGAVRQRIVRGVNGTRSVADIRLIGSAGSDDPRLTAALNHLGTFIDNAYRSTRDLNGEATMRRVANGQANSGLGAWAIVLDPARIRKMPMPYEPSVVERARASLTGRAAPRTRVTERVIRPARVRWEAIRFEDLLYFDGYGVDFNAMPLAGYYVRKTWADVTAWVAQGHYYNTVSADIRAHYEVSDSMHPAPADVPELLAPHQIAQVYTDWDIDGDGFLEPIVVDYHRDAAMLLRVAWSQFDGYRPIVAAQFDDPAVDGDCQGQGICEKLEDAQEETNAVHNVTIEAGKRGILPIVVGRKNSALDRELAATGNVTPGEYYATDDVEKDINVIHLADPRVIEAGMALESQTRGYVVRMLGRDEAGVGNVESAKRVPGGLGSAILQEGRVPIEDAMGSLAAAMQEAFYLTIHAWQRVVPVAQLQSALDPETVSTLLTLVFNRSALDVRERFQVLVRAQDVAATEQAKQQSLLVLNNFLIGHFSRVTETLMLIFQMVSSPTIPPSAKPIISSVLVTLFGKMQNAVELLLRTVDEIEDPRAVLLPLADIEQATRALAEMFAAAPAGAGGGAAPTAQPTNGAPVDLGGGVA